MNYLIVGLGNPGEQYIHTRHNIGQLVLSLVLAGGDVEGDDIDWQKRSDLSARMTVSSLGSDNLFFLFPETYMNLSGASVAKTMKKEKIDKLIVVHDDLALPLGEIRISVGRGDGGHNGVKSIVEALGHKDFIRLRLGIAYEPTGLLSKIFKPKRGGKDFVLGKFSTREMMIVKSLEQSVAKILTSVVTEGVEVAMNKFN